jgi:hypothetical protein
MTIPENCPICARPSRFIKPVLDDIQITANVNGRKKKVSALRAFICMAEHHVFFVRAADLDFRAEKILGRNDLMSVVFS